MSDRDTEERWEGGGTPDEAVEGGGNRPETLRKVDGRRDAADTRARETTAGPPDGVAAGGDPDEEA